MNETIRATNYANTELVEERTPKMKGISYLLLGITIFISVSAAILTTDAIKWGAAVYAAKIAIETANQKLQAELKITAQRQAEERKIAEANRIRSENAAEVQKKRMETCKFWNNEFSKTNSEIDKNHRNNACRDAGINYR